MPPRPPKNVVAGEALAALLIRVNEPAGEGLRASHRPGAFLRRGQQDPVSDGMAQVRDRLPEEDPVAALHVSLFSQLGGLLRRHPREVECVPLR